jgi:hypothetical protein
MIGKRREQRSLFEVGNVFPVALDPDSFHGQLAQAAPRLFRDEEFAAFYDEHKGRPSVPPSQLALLTLLQHEAGVSDAEAVARSAYDLRWAAVLGTAAGVPLCAKSTLQLFRGHLVLHEKVDLIFQRSLREARRAGLLQGEALRIAVDTKPIVGRGAVEDTYNLLATGIRLLGRQLAALAGQKAAEWLRGHALERYTAPSVKGSAPVDWSDAVARQQFLAQIVGDARRLLGWAGTALVGRTPEEAAPVREAAGLLERLLLQDVAERPGRSDGPTVQLREGTAKGRIPSATDPEQRHGRKSKQQRFTGHKVEIATDVASQLVVAAGVLWAEGGDAQAVLERVEEAEENTGQKVDQTVGDCAYGGGPTRQAFADAERELVARVPQEVRSGGLYPKRVFGIDLLAGSVTCPAGQTTTTSKEQGDGSRKFEFLGRCTGCPQRAACTTAGEGRTVTVGAQEGLLQAARAFQATPEGRAVLRERQVVEHRLARLAQLGIRQARYVGRAKTRCQLLLLATIANLRRTWNWAQEQATAGVVAPGGLATAA